jgi:hypothetical protein
VGWSKQAGSGKKSKRGGARFSHKKSSTKRILAHAEKMDAAPLIADAVRDQDRSGSGEEEEGGGLEAEVGGVGGDAGASSSQESHEVPHPISSSSPHRRPRQKRSRSPEAEDSAMGVVVDGKGAHVLAEGEGKTGGEGKAKAADGEPIDTAPAWRQQRPVRARRDKPNRPFDPSDDGPAARVEVPGSQWSKEDKGNAKEDKSQAKDQHTDLTPLHSSSPRKGAALLRAPAYAAVR